MLLFPCWAVPLAVAGEFVAECFPYRVAVWDGVLCGGLLWVASCVAVRGFVLLFRDFSGDGDAQLDVLPPIALTGEFPPAALHVYGGFEKSLSLLDWNGGCDGHVATVDVDGVWQCLRHVQEAMCACLVVHSSESAGV